MLTLSNPREGKIWLDFTQNDGSNSKPGQKSGLSCPTTWQRTWQFRHSVFPPFMQVKCYPSFSNIAWTVVVKSLFQIAVIFLLFLCVRSYLVLSFIQMSLNFVLLLLDSNNFSLDSPEQYSSVVMTAVVQWQWLSTFDKDAALEKHVNMARCNAKPWFCTVLSLSYVVTVD